MSDVNQVIANTDPREDVLLCVLGDESELELWYSGAYARKCLLSNTTTLLINVMLTREDGTKEILSLQPLGSEYLDREDVSHYNQASRLLDCTFTSQVNIWGFDYANECVSLQTYKIDNDGNRILASIVKTPLPNNVKEKKSKEQ